MVDAWQARPFRDENDYTLMHGLAVETLRQGGLPVYATRGSLDWSRCAAEPGAMTNVRLWFAGEKLVAFAWPEEELVEIVTAPGEPRLFDVALDWAMGDYAQTIAGPVAVRSFTGDALRNEALARRGGRPADFGSVLLGRRINPEMPAPALAPGFRFLPRLEAKDAERRAAVQRAAFESDFMTAERQRRVMSMPAYRPDLDVVLIVSDGSFAAFATVWLDEDNRIGHFEPVGVATRYQRQGLGLAVMREGLRRLAALGAQTAVVQTGIGHAPMIELARAARFSQVDRSPYWTVRL